MTHRLPTLLLAAALAATAPAHAASLADAEEMAGLFDRLCLNAFPNPAALDAEAARLHATALTPPQVQAYLHDDPGRGWSYATPLASYVITIEQPPYLACAIRRMTPAGLPSAAPFATAVNRYVAARHVTLVNAGRQDGKTQDGADLAAFQQAIFRPDKTVAETFLVILTNYHGRYQGPLSNDVGKGPGVEVRFVHQIPSPRG